MGDWLHPWTIEPCDLCGCEHALTRGDGRERAEEELCVACSERAEGYAEGRAAGIAEAEAHIVAWLRSQGSLDTTPPRIADRIEAGEARGGSDG